MQDRARSRARQMAQEFLQRGDKTGWFEPFYVEANGNEQAIHWADMISNPGLVEWLERQQINGHGRRALVVGCGLGDDAEELARRGFDVVAFDISPAAIAWCQRRFPDSPVHYVAVDALNIPSSWQHSFDFIFEAYTVQVLPADLHPRLASSLANCLTDGGTLLVICRGRSSEDQVAGITWSLTRENLDVFTAAGLRQLQFEDYLDHEVPPSRRFRVQYQRELPAN